MVRRSKRLRTAATNPSFTTSSHPTARSPASASSIPASNVSTSSNLSSPSPPPSPKPKSNASPQRSSSSSSPKRKRTSLPSLSTPSKPTTSTTTARKFPSPDIDYKQNPHLYRISRGEIGVLTCEPYKSHILPHWRFRTPSISRESVSSLLSIFNEHKSNNDFVGMDMTRKFLQMGYTRSMRYANHKGGRKYDGDGREIEKVDLGEDGERNEKEREKKVCAGIFWEAWKGVEADETYGRMKGEWKGRYG